MSRHLRARLLYLALALATIAVGLVVHLRGTSLSPAIRDVLGDALWAMMMTWCISTIAPTVRLPRRGATALAVSWAVELSQLYHTPAVDALRATTLGHLVLGTDFDARDLAAYALGVLGAMVLDRTFITRYAARVSARPQGPVS